MFRAVRTRGCLHPRFLQASSRLWPSSSLTSIPASSPGSVCTPSPQSTHELAYLHSVQQFPYPFTCLSAGVVLQPSVRVTMHVNQAGRQSINQPIHPSVNQSIIQFNQSINQTVRCPGGTTATQQTRSSMSDLIQISICFLHAKHSPKYHHMYLVHINPHSLHWYNSAAGGPNAVT